jgi:hypothetical protein
MVTQIRTTIGGQAVVGGGVSTFHITDLADQSLVQTAVQHVIDFWTEIAVGLTNDVTFQVQAGTSRYAAATGELQQIYSTTGSGVITGGVNTATIPRAAQGLIRWATDDIVAGRQIRGRTFLPGIPATQVTDTGLLSSAAITQYGGEANELLTALAAVLVIWHRPVAGAGGSEHAVTSASVWDNLAVLTSRRD